MILKKVYILLAFISVTASVNATVDAEILLYYKYVYIQGQFVHQDKINNPDNAILVPEFKTVMLPTEGNLYEIIFSQLKERQPEIYKNTSINIIDEKPVISITNINDKDFLQIKNEILASFRANIDAKDIEFIRDNKSENFYRVDYPIFTFESADAAQQNAPAPIEESLLNLPLWISMGLNILLIIYLIINRRNNARAVNN